MKKIVMLVELEYDDEITHSTDDDAIRWFYNDVLCAGNLLLVDHVELGDEIGTVRVIWVDKPFGVGEE